MHITLDERRDVGWLYHSNWPHGARRSLPARLPSYSMPVEHWFSTLLAHIIPPFLRGKLPGWKKKKDSLWSIGRLQLNSGYKLREMRREGEQEGGRVRMKTVHSGGLHSLMEVNMDLHNQGWWGRGTDVKQQQYDSTHQLVCDIFKAFYTFVGDDELLPAA